MKKKLLIILTVFMLSIFTCAFYLFNVVTFAAASSNYLTYNMSQSSTYPTRISISNPEYDKVRSNVKLYESDVKVSGRVYNAGDVNVFRFKAPYSQYYSFYTTAVPNTSGKYIGLRDTYISIKEYSRDFVWKKLKYVNSYKEILSDDDSCKIGDYYTGACVVVYLKKGTEVLVDVRGYGTKVGSYELYMEANRDKVSTKMFDYSMWCSGDSAYSTRKVYLNYSTAILSYMYLDLVYSKILENKCKEYGYTYFDDFYYSDVEQCMQMSNTLIGIGVGMGVSVLMSGPAGVIGGAVVSIASAGIGHIISLTYSDTSKESLRNLLITTCEIYADDFVYDLKTRTSYPVISIQYGLLIQYSHDIEYIPYYGGIDSTGYSTTLVPRVDYYRVDNLSIIEGVRGSKGNWI